jgi:hypothetical protein
MYGTPSKISPEAIKISTWLRFERCEPAYPNEIQAGTGIKLTPALIREGEQNGIFRYREWEGHGRDGFL